MTLTVLFLIVLSTVSGRWRTLARPGFAKYLAFGILWASLLIIDAKFIRHIRFDRTAGLESAAVAVLAFSLIGFLFFERLAPGRPEPYLYHACYLVLCLVLATQFPFESLDSAQDAGGGVSSGQLRTYSEAELTIAPQIFEAAKPFGIPKLHIKLLDQDDLGAYLDANGGDVNVVLTRGMRRAMTDPELLFVMTHEYAHFKLEHFKKRIYVIAGTLAIFFFLSAFLWGVTKPKQGERTAFEVFLSNAPLLLLVAFFLCQGPTWYFRRQEYEADRTALRATGDRAAAARVFEKMSGKLVLRSRFDFHPTPSDRLRQLNRDAREVLGTTNQSPSR